MGRGVAALAADPQILEKTGGAFASWTLARDYGFADIDGRRPDWEDYVRRSCEEILGRGGPKDAAERHWLGAWLGWKNRPGWADLISRAHAALAN